MSDQNKKQWLKRYRKNKALIERLEDRLLRLDVSIKTVKIPVLSDMPRGGTPRTMADLIADKMELEDRIKRLKDRGSVYRSEIISVIDDLDNVKYAEVLEAVFIEGITLEDLAERSNYTVRHIYRLYDEAIDAVNICQ